MMITMNFKEKRMFHFILFSFYIFIMLLLEYGLELPYSMLILFKTLLSGVAITLIYLAPRFSPSSRQRHRGVFMQWALVFSMAYLLIYMCSGLLFSFGMSPYSHHPMSIVKNLIKSSFFIFTIEYIRFYMVSLQKEREIKGLWIIFITICFVVLQVNYNMLMTITTTQELTTFLVRSILPLVATQFFLTHFSSISGIIPPLIYCLILDITLYFPPILPNLNWFIEGLIKFLLPATFYLILNHTHQTLNRKVIKRTQSEGNMISLTITLVLSILLVWFTSGLFPLYPSVIATGSMEPVIYPGDIIIVEKISETNVKEIEEGTIVAFESDKAVVCHRIVEVIEPISQYRTKGDNNNIEDQQILTVDRIKGIVKTKIPYLGWPTLLLKKSDPLNTDNYYLEENK